MPDHVGEGVPDAAARLDPGVDGDALGSGALLDRLEQGSTATASAPDDVAWLLDNTPGEIVIVRPSR